MAIGDRQNAIMEEILSLENIEKNWETEIVEHRILSLLAEKMA